MSAAKSVWPAPAKLNLFLHILGRRPDGYHELQTCFQFVDLCDEITHRACAPTGRFAARSRSPGLPAEADLCVRAARALQAAAGSPLGADIGLVKANPHGRRFGRRKFRCGHLFGGAQPSVGNCIGRREKLAALGLKLGADVPVFVHGRVAWAEGVGERLTPLYPPLAPTEANYLILKPNVFVSTAEVFQDPELTRNSPPITIHGFLASGGRNDCLGVVRRRYPEVAHALDWLSVFGSARLTGTGACVFLACETMDLGREILRKLPPAFEGFLARGLNDSPLLERLRTG